MKDAIQARRDALLKLIEQAGKRLSAATVGALNDAIAKLTSLLGEAEPEEDEAEQALQMLAQAMISGRSTSDTLEAFANRMWKAVRKAQEIPGSYKYPIFTWSDAVVVMSESYVENEGYVNTYYYAPYALSDGTITFGDVQAATVDTIIRLVSEQEGMQQLKQANAAPVGRMLESRGGEPLFLQILPGSIKLMQAKTSDGRSRIQGIATHGDVPNLNSPPVVYPTALWQSQISDMQTLIAQGKALGALGHPVLRT